MFEFLEDGCLLEWWEDEFQAWWVERGAGGVG